MQGIGKIDPEEKPSEDQASYSEDQVRWVNQTTFSLSSNMFERRESVSSRKCL
jgi:hypothetical protein